MKATVRLASTVAALCWMSALAWAQPMAVRYYQLDAIGSVLVVTDQNGAVVEEHDYDVYGQEVYPQAGKQPKRFTGKERDPETGFDYFGARYYSSKIGRFTTVDPAYTIQQNLVDPQRWNRYAYGRNNPLRYVDPDGRDFRDYVTGAANAFGSNFWFGQGRTAGGNDDFQFGQFVGDVASIPAGYAWGDAGAGAFTAGVAGAPESGGLSLVVSGAGVGMIVQGGTASLAGQAQAGIYLAKKLSDLTGGGKTGRKLSKDRLANQQDKIDQLRAERDELRSKANKMAEDKAALASKERELNRATDRLKGSEEHARKGQGSN